MSAPLQTWKVLPHGKLEQVDANIMTVVGEIQMPLMKLPRRMTVVRLAEGRLIIYSAIALDEDNMALIEAFGVPTYLVVPNARHRLDARIWKDRYPALQVVCPKGARDKVAEIVDVDTTEPVFDDPAVQFVTVAGTHDSDAVLIVRTSAGTTLVLNDIVGNIRDETGLAGWLLRMAGFAGSEPHVPKVVKLSMNADDIKALRGQLLQWAGIDSLKRILVSHGSSIENDPKGVLRGLAGALG